VAFDEFGIPDRRFRIVSKRNEERRQRQNDCQCSANLTRFHKPEGQQTKRDAQSRQTARAAFNQPIWKALNALGHARLDN
jgi:hypothetical protein